MAKLDAMGCTIVLTADHGMNAKFGADGKPDVIYLQDLFDGWLGNGSGRASSCRSPIPTSCITARWAPSPSSIAPYPAKWIARLAAMPGIEAALTKEQAAERFELPADRLGDIVVVSTKHKVLGTSASRHDLSGLTEPLRSHGGISEQRCH